MDHTVAAVVVLIANIDRVKSVRIVSTKALAMIQAIWVESEDSKIRGRIIFYIENDIVAI